MLSKKPKYNKLIDRELIELYKSSNDLNAVGELFARYSHLVVSIALGILGFVFLFKIGEAFLGRMSIVFIKKLVFLKGK